MDEAAIAKAMRLRHQEWPMGLKAKLLTNLFRGSLDLRVMPEKRNGDNDGNGTDKKKLNQESESQNLSLLSIFS